MSILRNSKAESTVAHVCNGQETQIYQETEHPTMEKIEAAPIATVDVALSHTKNIGNYESLKFHVGITLPCAPSKVDSAYQVGTQWCQKKLENLVGEMSGGAAPKPDPVQQIGKQEASPFDATPKAAGQEGQDKPPWEV